MRFALRHPIAFALATAVSLAFSATSGEGAGTVPTDIKLPGTQQLEVPTYTSPDNCDNCHGGYAATVEPAFLWRGGMMANATRDPLFWATVAVAEQDFLPGGDPATRGGAGDLCIRCHSVNGWIANRSTPTDGSALSATADTNGVECEFCHLMVDPDQPINISGTTEIQNDPFKAYDETTLEAHRGAAQYVVNGNGTRLGPYATNPPHAVIPSPFHRRSDLCATCHDVSNPAVGDLAPNNGAQLPLAAGKFSGTPGSPVAGKAAQNNPPYRYGIVERTFSEWSSSALSTWPVNSFPSLPAALRVTGGAFQVAYSRAYTARSNANYEDGTVRTYTCQTCHMSASTGKGCNKNGFPTRTDLPAHDQTGAGYWMPDVVQYMNTKGTLLIGGGLNQTQKDALNAGKVRAQQILQSAASVSGSQLGSDLIVRVTNLTGHKLLSGYPEGRRLWINVRWYDSGNHLVREDGAWGPIGRTAPDLSGVEKPVSSLLDPDNTVVYEAGMGMDQAWAAKLVSLGYPTGLVLAYDRLSDLPLHTLGELAASPAGTQLHTFHFVLNNVVVEDHRIPPYGFRYDDARARNALPVPANQFGSPAAGGTYNHWDDRAFSIPAGATSAQIRLYYQQTSWEYIQFLWKQNDQLSPFLKNEGKNLLDAWLNTSMSAPLQITMATVSGLIPPAATPPGEASHQTVRAETMKVVKSGSLLQVNYTPACGSTGHAFYFGNLADRDAFNWVGGACYNDVSGSVLLTPPAADVFFVVVGTNGVVEGSYGQSAGGIERPEAGLFGACGYPQQITGNCDVAKRGERIDGLPQ
jgi:hypothetical protein